MTLLSANQNAYIFRANDKSKLMNKYTLMKYEEIVFILLTSPATSFFKSFSILPEKKLYNQLKKKTLRTDESNCIEIWYPFFCLFYFYILLY